MLYINFRDLSLAEGIVASEALPQNVPRSDDWVLISFIDTVVPAQVIAAVTLTSKPIKSRPVEQVTVGVDQTARNSVTVQIDQGLEWKITTTSTKPA